MQQEKQGKGGENMATYPVVRVKNEMLEILQGELSNKAFAEALGLDYTHLWRVKSGRTNPGEDFIAKVLNAFPRKKFDDLFYLDKGGVSQCHTSRHAKLRKEE